jgi:hypothetical protein
MIHFKHSLNNMNLAFMADGITELYFLNVQWIYLTKVFTIIYI